MSTPDHREAGRRTPTFPVQGASQESNADGGQAGQVAIESNGEARRHGSDAGEGGQVPAGVAADVRAAAFGDGAAFERLYRAHVVARVRPRLPAGRERARRRIHAGCVRAGVGEAGDVRPRRGGVRFLAPPAGGERGLQPSAGRAGAAGAGDGKDRFRDRLSEYLDGGLGPEEETLVERHLASCEDCTRTLEELEAVVERAGRAGAREPGGDLWPGIAARIGADDRASCRQW